MNGRAEQIRGVASAYKVYYAKYPPGSADYVIDHSSFIYLVNENGNYIGFFPPGTTPTVWPKFSGCIFQIARRDNSIVGPESERADHVRSSKPNLAPFAIMAWLRKMIVELPRERAETRRGTGSRRASRRAIAIRT